MEMSQEFVFSSRRRARFIQLAANAFVALSLVAVLALFAVAGRAIPREQPRKAAEINYLSYVGWTASTLHARFPALPQGELNRLAFRIADVESVNDAPAVSVGNRHANAAAFPDASRRTNAK